MSAHKKRRDILGDLLGVGSSVDSKGPSLNELSDLIQICAEAADEAEVSERESPVGQPLDLYFPEDETAAYEEIITNDLVMHAIFQNIISISRTKEPVLITGEPGTGKDLIVREIHRRSGLIGRLVTVNAAGSDDNVFSDTMFGHKKGAFPGADRNRIGLVEKAVDGTLFLDEIGDLSPASQVKLLRLLQDNEFLPLGETTCRYSDTRIIAVTSIDLWTLQKMGKFRKDLNFKLRTHHINVPPLRERKDDIPLLVEHFVDVACNSLSKKKPALPKDLIPLLKSYAFPDNVRELESLIFDAISRHSRGKTLSLEVFKEHIAKKKMERREAFVEPLDMASIKHINTALLLQKEEQRAAKRKTTYYITEEIFQDLDDAKDKIKKILPAKMKRQVSKSGIVDFALKLILMEFESKGEQSMLMKRIFQEEPE